MLQILNPRDLSYDNSYRKSVKIIAWVDELNLNWIFSSFEKFNFRFQLYLSLRGLIWLKHAMTGVVCSHARRPISVHMSKVGQILPDKIVIRVFTAFYCLLSLSERATLDTILFEMLKIRTIAKVRSIRRWSGLTTAVPVRYVAVKFILAKMLVLPKMKNLKIRNFRRICLKCLRYCLE